MIERSNGPLLTVVSSVKHEFEDSQQPRTKGLNMFRLPRLGQLSTEACIFALWLVRQGTDG